MAMAMLFPPKKLPDMIPCSMLHKQFIAKDGIKRVRVYATAHGVYRLFINGQRVDDCELAPEFSVYPKVLFYQTYDATALVESGKNAIGVILADGWCCGHIGMSGSSCQYGDTHALLLQMEIEYADGSKDIVTSDEGFKFSDSGPYVYSDLFIGERYDARNEMPIFSKAELDTKSWKSVHFANESMDCLHAFYGEPVRRVKEIPATEVIITPKSEIVIDFGQNIAGRVKTLAPKPTG
jgi:alpha-L-rhamnosidase